MTYAAPQSCLVPGMPSSLLERAEERLPSWYIKSPLDVFCLVKAFVSDNDLCQDPLLVLPGCKLDDMMHCLTTLARSSAVCFLA